MRLIEVRKFDRGYLVYVNTPCDITTLDANKKFKLYSIYTVKGEMQGKEYMFTCQSSTHTDAQSWIKKTILDPVYKIAAVQEELKEKQNVDGVKQDFSDRGIIISHKTTKSKRTCIKRNKK